MGQPCAAAIAEAQSLLSAQNIPGALAAINRCLTVDPQNSSAVLLKGNLLYLSGRDSDAIETLQDLVRREPSNWDARYALGRVYYFNDRPDPACAQFEAILAAQPGNYRAWDNLGLAREAAGLIPQAIEAHVRAIALVSKDHPEYDWAHANLAELLMKQDDNRKAFDLAVEAAQRNPNGARNYFLAGKALTRLDQWAKSERWFLKAAELDAAYPTPHYFLAQVYRRLGRPADAERERKIFKELQDKAPDKKR
jgi:tetratricopeptide (TPR) repeat protein